MSYELFCNSVRGFSHVKKEIPCEDFGIKRDQGEYKIFAVADGHGDPNCLRSSTGSKYICQIVATELESFANTVKEQAWEEKLLDHSESEQLINRLIVSIIGKWISAVNEELEQNPFTDEELEKAPVYANDYKKGIRIERMYGTTLIAGLLTEKYLLLLQQGDGRCDVFNEDGNVSQPIPWDDRCIGTSTTSLCDNDAVQSCRYHVIDLSKNPIIAVVAGTDGVEDSFPGSMEKTHAYYRDLLCYACENGVDALEDYLTDALAGLSANGSADDITVSGIIDTEKTKLFLPDFKRKNGIVELEDEVAFLEGKIRSIEDGGKFQYLTKKYKEALNEYNRVMRKFCDASIACSTLSETISAQEQGFSETIQFGSLSEEILAYIKKLFLPRALLTPLKQELEKRIQEKEQTAAELQVAEEEKNRAEKEYIPYKARYDDFVQRRGEAIQKLNEVAGEQMI